MIIIKINAMVFQKNNRKTFKKKTTNKSAMSVARQALTKVNKLNQSVEVKRIDITASVTPITALVGHIFSIVSIGSGTTDSTMIGDKVVLKNISFKFQHAIAGSAFGSVREIYFRIAQPYSGTPAITDVLKTVDPMSQYLRDPPFKFQVLSDRTYNANRDGELGYHIRTQKLNISGKVFDNNDGTYLKGQIIRLIVHDCSTDIGYNMRGIVTFTDA